MDSTDIRLIRSRDTEPLFNIALEEALHLSVEDGLNPVIRFWRCEKAVILGHSRRVEKDVYVDKCRADGIPIIRRHSGGGTVYLHRDILNFTIIVPYMHSVLKPRSKIRESIYFLLNPVVNALKLSRLSVDIIGNGDIFLNGRKVGGNAQARKKRTILHHGTLMILDRVGDMSEYLRIPEERSCIPHTDFVTSFEAEDLSFNEDEILPDMVEGWKRELGLREIITAEPTDEEIKAAQRLVEVKYSRVEHSFRR